MPHGYLNHTNKLTMKYLNKLKGALLLLLLSYGSSKAQITLLQDYVNQTSAKIGTFMGVNFREAGFSGMYPVPGTNGKEFWVCSDRGVNVDCGSANTSSCRPTYDKMYSFPSYAPKIHRVRIQNGKVEILQTISIKRPNGTGATGIINPTGLGSTATEVASTDTVLNCANFSLKTTPKDTFGIDCEGIVVDKQGYFWLCEEGGPTIWKLNQNGVVIKRFTPYFNLPGVQAVDAAIDTCFKYRKNNRGFESITIAPNGKIYAIIQSPLLFPTQSIGESTRIHRILEIDPQTNAMRMLVYLNDGIIGSSGSNQIRLRDWKVGDMAAINDSTFLVLEAAARGTTDIKRMYMININNATAVHSGLYGSNTLEALVDSTGLANNGIKAVRKTLVMDMLANSWPAALDKAEGIAILNDSTIAICNDNDYGQTCPNADGIPVATSNLSHIITYRLSGANKLVGFTPAAINVDFGLSAPNSSQTPYLVPAAAGVKFTSVLTAGDSVGNYAMAGTPDGAGLYDNNNGTFTMLLNHEFGNTAGGVRAHGAKGAFVSKWIINKNDLSVVSGADLIQNVQLYTPNVGYSLFTPNDTTSKKAFNRFCSADLPEVSAFYNATTGKGTQERMFMNGEESGNEGRAFAHIATGANAGTTWELPALGKFSWENAVASNTPQDKTIVVGMDDSTPGQVYVYVGTKTNTGTEVEKAGLTNGKLYGVAVQNLTTEVNGSFPAANTTFTLVDLGNVKDSTGSSLNTRSNALGVTNFLRPEDGAWDPSNPNDFYFATTNAVTSPSRLWRLRFDNIANPELGGKITAVLDGTEGQKMMDNITIDKYGHILIVEDVGNNVHLGKTWQYTIATDQLKLIASHDSTRFISGAANFLTQDEEASGVIDAEKILGPGMFMIVDQAHYGVAGSTVEGGQILALFNPDTYNGVPLTTVAVARTAAPTDTVRFQGVITRAEGRLIYLQDSTAGLAVFQSSGAMFDSIASTALKPGDFVEVVGPMVHFSNLQEISLPSGAYTEYSRVTKLATKAVPAAVKLTAKQLNNNGELYESMLVRVENLKTTSTGSFAASTNYTVWDGATTGDTIVLRTPSAVDTKFEDAPALSIPKGLFTFEGVIGQFCSSPSTECVKGYQLTGVSKATDIIPQLNAVNLLTPATNTRLLTHIENTSAVNFTWDTSFNATSYRWFVTKNSGSFTTPLVRSSAITTNSFAYLNNMFDTLVAKQNVAKGDSIELKWTVYAYLNNDSMIAAQTNVIRVVRQPDLLTPFAIVTPANNYRYVAQENSVATIPVKWQRSKYATRYKVLATLINGNFAAPVYSALANQNGADTTFTIESGAIYTLLANYGIAKGDSLPLKWTVFAYKNNNDSLKATADLNINFVRERKLHAFNLLTPNNNSRSVVANGNLTPITFTWDAITNGVTYTWLIDANSTFTSPWLTKQVTTNSVTLTSNELDQLLAARSIAEGDSVQLKWTVKATETNDSMMANAAFNINLVRKLTTGLNNPAITAAIDIYPNPTSGNSTFTYTGEDLGAGTIRVIDLNGRELIAPIATSLHTNTMVELPTANLATGVYFVTITTNEHTANFKLIVVH